MAKKKVLSPISLTRIARNEVVNPVCKEGPFGLMSAK
jgi:hypothetical protein